MFTGCSRSFQRSFLRWSLNCEKREGGREGEREGRKKGEKAVIAHCMYEGISRNGTIINIQE